jgi:AhpD family alkylhydroperoxidase
MGKNYKEMSGEIAKALPKLGKELPGVMGAFQALHEAAAKDGALSKKTKELIAIALAVAARCDGCITFHTQALIQLGVTKEELVEALGMAIVMGGGPAVMYAAEVLKAFDDLKM